MVHLCSRAAVPEQQLPNVQQRTIGACAEASQQWLPSPHPLCEHPPQRWCHPETRSPPSRGPSSGLPYMIQVPSDMGASMTLPFLQRCNNVQFGLCPISSRTSLHGNDCCGRCKRVKMPKRHRESLTNAMNLTKHHAHTAWHFDGAQMTREDQLPVNEPYTPPV